MDAGSIQKNNLRTLQIHNAFDRAAGSLWLFGNDRQFSADQCIEQGRLACVGPANNRNKARSKAGGVRHVLLLLLSKPEPVPPSTHHPPTLQSASLPAQSSPKRGELSPAIPSPDRQWWWIRSRRAAGSQSTRANDPDPNCP